MYKRVFAWCTRVLNRLNNYNLRCIDRNPLAYKFQGFQCTFYKFIISVDVTVYRTVSVFSKGVILRMTHVSSNPYTEKF